MIINKFYKFEMMYFLLYVKFDISLKNIKNRNSLLAVCYWYLLVSSHVSLVLSGISIDLVHIQLPVVYMYKTSH